MDRFWVRTVVGGLALGAIGLLSAACAHNDQTLFIQGVMAPPAAKVGSTCLYQPSAQGAFISEGLFDVGIGSTYTAWLQLGNQMVERGPAGPGSDPVHAETSRIVINGAEVKISDAVGNQLDNFTSVASSFVDVGAGGTAGIGAVGITAVNAKSAAALCGQFPDPTTRRQLVLTIKAFGKTLGGTDIESQEFTFPVTVCKGCLVDRSSACIPPAGSTTTTIDITKLPCQQGADNSTPCQACASDYPDVCTDTPVAGRFAAACAAK